MSDEQGSTKISLSLCFVQRNRAHETGLGRISGEEDPVELDSRLTFQEEMDRVE